MQERIVDIIVYLLEEFKQKQQTDKYTDLSKELLSRGYTESEINLAFSWIFSHLQKKSKEGQEEFSYSTGSIRVLHDLESLVIAPDAYGYLLQLWQLGIIREPDIEDVIEKALSLGSTHITLDDVKSLAASILFNPDLNDPLEGFFFHNGTNAIH
jgi:uncharacterized protein Smg (DUF494 family)